MNETQQFYAACGEIVLVSTSIEYTLGQHLTVFLIHRKPLITQGSENKYAHKTFGQKILILEKLCNEKNVNSENKERLLKALYDIKRIRNSIGHWGASYDEQTKCFRLHDLRSKKHSSEPLDAIKAAQEVNELYFVVYHGLTDLYNEIFFSQFEKT